jgi:hypothetical protein
MSDKFDIVDRFKGKFHKEEKKSVVEELNRWFTPEEIDNRTGIPVSEQLELPKGTMTPDELLEQCPLTKHFDELIASGHVVLCNHDPIDVGFTTPKMVCRKCDTDL